MLHFSRAIEPGCLGRWIRAFCPRTLEMVHWVDFSGRRFRADRRRGDGEGLLLFIII